MIEARTGMCKHETKYLYLTSSLNESLTPKPVALAERTLIVFFPGTTCEVTLVATSIHQLQFLT